MGILRAILGDPAERRLLRDLRNACRREGVELPRRIGVHLEGDRARIRHAMAPATAPARQGEAVHPLLVGHAIATARAMALRDARDALSHALRSDIDALPAPWTRLVHPLALRMALTDLGGRERGPWDWMTGSTSRIRDFHFEHRPYGTIEFSRMMLMRADDPQAVEAVFTFLPAEDGAPRAEIAVTRAVPQAAAAMLEGRPLSDLVAFAPTADPHLDAAVAGLVVERASALERSTVATLRPTRWITWSEPPLEHQGWEERARYEA